MIPHRYMAPEVLSGRGYNLKADVYCFAVILWEMLAGQKPFAFVRSMRQLKYHVVKEHGRPSIDDRWPAKIKGMLAISFDVEIEARPVSDGSYSCLHTVDPLTFSEQTCLFIFTAYPSSFICSCFNFRKCHFFMT